MPMRQTNKKYELYQKNRMNLAMEIEGNCEKKGENM